MVTRLHRSPCHPRRPLRELDRCIWFLVTDPRIVENPVPIETITYKELRELAYMGASVLHEDAIFPVRREGIPSIPQHQQAGGSGYTHRREYLPEAEIYHHRYRRKDWFLLCHHRESDDELRNWVWEKSSGRLRGLRYFLRAYAVRNRYDDPSSYTSPNSNSMSSSLSPTSTARYSRIPSSLSPI